MWKLDGPFGANAEAMQKLMRPVVDYARRLCKMVRSFVNLKFPDHDWRRKWCAFDCSGGALAEKTRLKFVRELAEREGLDPGVCFLFSL